MIFPEVKFEQFPSSEDFSAQRRGKPFMNDIYNQHLFLNAAPIADEKEQELASIDSSKNDPVLDRPYRQILETINGMEKGLNKRIDQLQKLGAEGYLEKKSANSTNPHLDETEKCGPLAGAVVATKQVKTTPPKRKKSTILPINEHNSKRKKQKSLK